MALPSKTQGLQEHGVFRNCLDYCMVFGLVSMLSVTALQPVNASEKANMKPTIKSVDEFGGELAEFEKTKQIPHLEKAFQIANFISSPIPPRQQKLRMWLKIMVSIDHNLDPSFNINDSARMNVSPPGGAYRAGIDPKDVKDPAIRAEYEELIRKNKEKRERRHLQNGLRHINEQLMFAVERFVRKHYTSSAEDQKELDQLLRETGISEARKQKLKALFGKGQGKQ